MDAKRSIDTVHRQMRNQIRRPLWTARERTIVKIRSILEQLSTATEILPLFLVI